MSSSVKLEPAPTAPIFPAESLVNWPLETRKFGSEEKEIEFNFLVVDKPEKLEGAAKFQHAYALKFPGSPKKLNIKFRSISYKEWEGIDIANPMPIKKMGDDSKAAELTHQKLSTATRAKRKIAVFELATGSKVPGNSLDEKVEWVSHLGVGEVDAFFTEIIEQYSAVNDGNALNSYNAEMSQDNSMHEVVEFTDFNDWLKVSQGGSIFRMQRPWETFIIEIPFRQLSDAQKTEIDEKIKDPIPPSKPGKNPLTGQPDMNYPDYNYNDPKYVRLMLEASRNRLVMQFEAVLPFPIPGSTFNEKYNWIGDLLVGDVLKIKKYIDQELSNYRNRLDFF